MKKITAVYCENFSAVSKINVSFNPNVTYLCGFNGSAKTTIGETIIKAVSQGIAKKASKDKIDPVSGSREEFIGSNGKKAITGVVFIDEKHGEVKVERTFTKSSEKLTIEAESGANLDQEWLNSFWSKYLIDPVGFSNLTPKQQALSLGIDTDKYDKEIEAKNTLYKEIKSKVDKANKKVTELEAVSEFIKEYSEKKQSEEVMSRLKAASNYNVMNNERLKSLSQKNKDIETAKKDIEDYRKRIEQLKEKVKQSEKDIVEINNKIEEHNFNKENHPEEYCVDTINKEFSKINDHNDKHEKVKELKEAIKVKTENEAEEKQKKNALEKAKQDKLNYIQNSNLPFKKQLSINEKGELLIDGRYFKAPHYSQGELVTKATMIMSKISDSDFKYVFIKDWSLLDPKNQEKVLKFLNKNEFQVVAECVTNEGVGEKNKIVLESCQVKWDGVKGESNENENL